MHGSVNDWRQWSVRMAASQVAVASRGTAAGLSGDRSTEAASTAPDTACSRARRPTTPPSSAASSSAATSLASTPSENRSSSRTSCDTCSITSSNSTVSHLRGLNLADCRSPQKKNNFYDAICYCWCHLKTRRSASADITARHPPISGCHGEVHEHAIRLSVSSDSVAHRLLRLPSISDDSKTVHNETV